MTNCSSNRLRAW